MDYGRRVEFGISVVPTTADLETTRALVRAADAAAVDLVGIQDHPYQRRFLDTMALIATLLAETSHVRIFPDVANLPLRAPALLAKEAASLDVLSGGRFELGLGAGGFWDAIEAMGGPRRSPGESVEALEEAIAIIRIAWQEGEVVRFKGKHYEARGYRAGPAPVHSMEIWVGAYKPRMLRLIGRRADGWLPSLGYIEIDEIRTLQETIDEAARKAGREPSAIRRMLNVGGSIGSVPDGGGLGGSVEEWAERLGRWTTEAGLDTFIFWPAIADPVQVETWGAEVAPRARVEVEQRRAMLGGSPR